MENKMVKTCPACGGKMYVAGLKCEDCGIEINGRFSLSEEQCESPLTGEDFLFVKKFLGCEGNLSKLGEEEGMSYSEIKAKLRAINEKLGNQRRDGEMTYLERTQEDGALKPSDIIIQKLNEQNGRAFCKMLKGDAAEIRLTEKGVISMNYQNLVCEWRIFDAIVEKAKQLGGKMYRGDAAARSGKKVGSPELPLDCMEGFLATTFYGASIGSATTRRSTYYAAILAWAGICENCRSDGNGGYIKLL